MARHLTRSRPTKVLVELAWKRFHGCEECCREAFDCIDDVLAPLRLKARERRRLFRNLTCPSCESKVQWGTSVRAPSEEQVRQSMLSRKFDRIHRREIEAFRAFLIRVPMLGARHPFGQLLFKAMRKAKKTVLEPSRWYRATTELDRPRFQPRPQHQAARANRFNQIGQVAWYLSEDKETAAVEALRLPRPGRALCVAEIEILDPLPVLDLRTALSGEDPSGHWVLRNVVDRSFVSEPTDDVAESRPQYRLPQYVADLARKEGFRGILYNSTRPSAYDNPDAVGDNLVLFDPIPAYVVRSEATVEFAEPDHSLWGLIRVPILVTRHSSSSPKPITVYGV